MGMVALLKISTVENRLLASMRFFFTKNRDDECYGE
jgi:hypothetical protein